MKSKFTRVIALILISCFLSDLATAAAFARGLPRSCPIPVTAHFNEQALIARLQARQLGMSDNVAAFLRTFALLPITRVDESVALDPPGDGITQLMLLMGTGGVAMVLNLLDFFSWGDKRMIVRAVPKNLVRDHGWAMLPAVELMAELISQELHRQHQPAEFEAKQIVWALKRAGFVWPPFQPGVKKPMAPLQRVQNILGDLVKSGRLEHVALGQWRLNELSGRAPRRVRRDADPRRFIEGRQVALSAAVIAVMAWMILRQLSDSPKKFSLEDIEQQLDRAGYSWPPEFVHSAARQEAIQFALAEALKERGSPIWGVLRYLGENEWQWERPRSLSDKFLRAFLNQQIVDLPRHEIGPGTARMMAWTILPSLLFVWMHPQGHLWLTLLTQDIPGWRWDEVAILLNILGGGALMMAVEKKGKKRTQVPDYWSDQAAVASQIEKAAKDPALEDRTNPSYARTLRSLNRRYDEREHFTPAEIRFAKLILTYYMNPEPTIPSPERQKTLIEQSRHISTMLLGSERRRALSGFLLYDSEGISLTPEQLDYLESILRIARERQYFDEQVLRIRSGLRSTEASEFRRAIQRFIDLIDLVLHERTFSTYQSSVLHRLVRDAGSDAVKELHPTVLNYIEHQSVFADQEESHANPERTDSATNLTDVFLIDLLRDIAKISRLSALRVLSDSVMHRGGLAIRTQSGMEAAIQLMSEFSEEAGVREALQAYLNPALVPAPFQEWWHQQKVQEQIAAILAPPSVDEDPSAGEEVIEPTVTASEARLQVANALRAHWSAGDIPLPSWLRQNDPELYRRIRDREIFGSVESALEAAGIPRAFHQESQGTLSHLEITRQHVRELPEEDLDVTIAVKKHPGVLRSALVHYPRWSQALIANGREPMPFPELDQVTAETIDVRLASIAQRTEFKNRLQSVKRHLEAAKQEFRKNYSNKALAALRQARTELDELNRLAEVDPRFAGDIEELTRYVVSHILQAQFSRVPSTTVRAAAASESAAIEQIVQAAGRIHSELISALPTENLYLLVTELAVAFSGRPIPGTPRMVTGLGAVVVALTVWADPVARELWGGLAIALVGVVFVGIVLNFDLKKLIEGKRVNMTRVVEAVMAQLLIRHLQENPEAEEWDIEVATLKKEVDRIGYAWPESTVHSPPSPAVRIDGVLSKLRSEDDPAAWGSFVKTGLGMWRWKRPQKRTDKQMLTFLAGVIKRIKHLPVKRDEPVKEDPLSVSAQDARKKISLEWELVIADIQSRLSELQEGLPEDVGDWQESMRLGMVRWIKNLDAWELPVHLQVPARKNLNQLLAALGVQPRDVASYAALLRLSADTINRSQDYLSGRAEPAAEVVERSESVSPSENFTPVDRIRIPMGKVSSLLDSLIGFEARMGKHHPDLWKWLNQIIAKISMWQREVRQMNPDQISQDPALRGLERLVTVIDRTRGITAPKRILAQLQLLRTAAKGILEAIAPAADSPLPQQYDLTRAA